MPSESIWEAELSKLATEASRLLPAVRRAVSGVLVSLLDERSLTMREAELAEAVLAPLRLSQTGSAARPESGIDLDRELVRRAPIARARRTRAIAIETREDARALRAQASQQVRRARRAIEGPSLDGSRGSRNR